MQYGVFFIYFEKENIFTFDGKGELLLTIMSSLAQEESRSISENVTWGQRKRFADGKVCMPYSRFLGYEKGEDGSPVVNEAEAEIVRAIYRLYLSGKTARGICLELEQWGVPSPGGSEKWSPTTVRSILKNEKYKGDALLQKKYTVDFLSKKMKANEGEIPQYYVENSHPAIIDPIEFDMVQVEIARRKQLGRAYSGNSVFSSKLICADCGGFYGQKVWHSNDAHRRVIWQCNSKFKNAKRCTTPHLDAETVQWMFLEAYNRFLGSREQVIADCEIVSETLCDCTVLDAEIAKAREEIEVIAELVKKSVAQNASAAQSQEDYEQHYTGLVKRFEKAERKLDALNVEKARRQSKDKEMRLFIATLRKQPLALDAWDERLWIALVKKGTVHPGGMIVFTFKDGTEIEVEPK